MTTATAPPRAVPSPIRVFQARLHAVRGAKLVDYPAVASCQLEILELLFRSFRERYRQDPEKPRAPGCFANSATPGDGRYETSLSSRRSPSARRSRVRGSLPQLGCGSCRIRRARRFGSLHEELAERVEYYRYLQWQAERQLADVRRVSERLGMSIGLYHDLAVGVEAGGAEAWDWQAVLASGASVGAPPDDWNHNGQDLGPCRRSIPSDFTTRLMRPSSSCCARRCAAAALCASITSWD